MKRILKTFVAIAALMLCINATSFAQVDGYRFGVGLNYSGYGDGCHGNWFGRNFFGLPIAPTPRIDQPPFFATYPPVYYSQEIVARPYGVSPYAAPPGIVPVEMSGIVPLHQVNPYYVNPMPPADGEQPPAPPADGAKDANPKTTWIRNPFHDRFSPSHVEIADNR